MSFDNISIMFAHETMFLRLIKSFEDLNLATERYELATIDPERIQYLSTDFNWNSETGRLFPLGEW